MIVHAACEDAESARVIALFEQYHAEIFAYLCRLAKDREEAKDLTQETFLKAFRARARLSQIQNPRAWLYRIATNLALNVLKRQRRFAWLPAFFADQRAEHAQALAEQASERSAVEEALRALPPDYRVALLLYAHHGFSVAQVAQMVGIGEGAVKMRLYRAREMFRQAYERGSAQ